MGLVIFLILVTIQFMVITKGAGRIAEVAARFTLDAMPGKQMAIDADLRSGLISQENARAMRTELSKESQLHGAMDDRSGDFQLGELHEPHRRRESLQRRRAVDEPHY